ncbi:type II secretion system protein F (GspF) [Corynebacterium coyleae]|uniref:Type II secretion system F family protein n=1 Tax=Corynebacterium coyleae TaxID=53374 RepID=A0ABX8KZ88_9CORY|nr:type II secretion system F family protein [Corynebacterium coyleae]QXB19525.1 type II secretion system F family protein [Corynebacterium coyleae]WJY78811.1 Bacterial type II secretion system protein F domain protein [Corynebacterium coyleae]SEB58402.1 type II secretion system protein F (GspF) [Corynebacterium coyleae]
MTTLLLLAGAAACPPPAPSARIAPRSLAVPPRIAIPLVVGAVVLAALAFDRASLVIALAMGAATVVWVADTQRRARAASKRTEAVATFLGHLGTNVEAGAPLHAALERAAEHAPREIARDVAHLIHHVTTGAPLAAETDEFARIAPLFALSTSRGVPLSRLVAAARDDIDHARRHRATTNAALAGPKTTAVVLALLPFAGLLMGAAMGANPLALLTGGGLGGVLLTVGTALVCAGVIVSQLIIQGATT